MAWYHVSPSEYLTIMGLKLTLEYVHFIPQIFTSPLFPLDLISQAYFCSFTGVFPHTLPSSAAVINTLFLSFPITLLTDTPTTWGHGTLSESTSGSKQIVSYWQTQDLTLCSWIFLLAVFKGSCHHIYYLILKGRQYKSWKPH